jgi:hypothetical protein
VNFIACWFQLIELRDPDDATHHQTKTSCCAEISRSKVTPTEILLTNLLFAIALFPPSFLSFFVLQYVV